MSKKKQWWDRISDATMRLVYNIRDPRAARIHARRSEGARKGWETRRRNSEDSRAAEDLARMEAARVFGSDPTP